MRDQIRLIGILNVVLGSIGALIGVVIFLAFGGLASAVGFGASGDSGIAPASLLAVIGFVVAGFIIVLSLPMIIGGWGLMTFKPWSRILMIVVSAINLIHVPFGTALGIFGLIVLLNEQSRQILESGGVLFAQPVVHSPNYPPPAI